VSAISGVQHEGELAYALIGSETGHLKLVDLDALEVKGLIGLVQTDYGVRTLTPPPANGGAIKSIVQHQGADASLVVLIRQNKNRRVVFELYDINTMTTMGQLNPGPKSQFLPAVPPLGIRLWSTSSNFLHVGAVPKLSVEEEEGGGEGVSRPSTAQDGERPSTALTPPAGLGGLHAIMESKPGTPADAKKGAPLGKGADKGGAVAAVEEEPEEEVLIVAFSQQVLAFSMDEAYNRVKPKLANLSAMMSAPMLQRMMADEQPEQVPLEGRNLKTDDSKSSRSTSSKGEAKSKTSKPESEKIKTLNELDIKGQKAVVDVEALIEGMRGSAASRNARMQRVTSKKAELFQRFAAEAGIRLD
jgi:hypothetical protein